jgi:hypothetical protein
MAVWQTEEEIKFIKKLGTGKIAQESEGFQSKTRAELLRGYLMGARLRREWGEIDSHKVITFAQEELRQEMARAA